MDRSMIDAASGGALMDKTPVAARHLISNMASNTQQFGIRGPSQPRMVNEIGAASNLRLENQLTKLTSLVRQLAIGQYEPTIAAKVCGICTSREHPIGLCPTLQETESDQPKNVKAIGGYQYGKQPYQSRPLDNQQLSTTDSTISSTTIPIAAATKITISRQFSIFGGANEATCSQQFGISAICKLQQHVVLAKYERYHPRPQDADRTSARSNNLPSQPILNPRGNASAVTLRSGKELSQPAPQLPRLIEADSGPDANSQEWQQEKIVPLPFPTQTLLARKHESAEELLKMFRKVEINISFLDTIKQISKYAKFLKELCVHKRKNMKGSVEMGGIVSTLTKNEEVTT
ncbi:hypothetical protein CR513_40319, partial [Mucuna pruriens]